MSCLSALTSAFSNCVGLSCVPVSRADDLTPMSAYVGENVTLLSGAHPSWDLLSITWSIWTNTTWIATYSEGKINVSRFYKYKGRLSLDRHTGIHANINAHIKFKKRLQKPNITTFQSSTKDECLFALRCSSSDSGVTLSWESHPQLQRYESTNNSIMGILKAAQNITCIARKNTDAASRTVPVKCGRVTLLQNNITQVEVEVQVVVI
uniref:Ig-like domain-containing protein n=1 Tax=Periophthalmus magnuspinnatus TaxID=409849 RepID=A0A3B3ZLJ4_9GOBI